jgi:hypothetical protein
MRRKVREREDVRSHTTLSINEAKNARHNFAHAEVYQDANREFGSKPYQLIYAWQNVCRLIGELPRSGRKRRRQRKISPGSVHHP